MLMIKGVLIDQERFEIDDLSNLARLNGRTDIVSSNPTVTLP